MSCYCYATLEYLNTLYQVFDCKPLVYTLFLNNLCQRQRLIGHHAIEFDLLTRSCAGWAIRSIEWCALDPVASNGLSEALRTLASDFGSPPVSSVRPGFRAGVA